METNTIPFIIYTTGYQTYGKKLVKQILGERFPQNPGIVVFFMRLEF
jgi:hypothetical protein